MRQTSYTYGARMARARRFDAKADKAAREAIDCRSRANAPDASPVWRTLAESFALFADSYAGSAQHERDMARMGGR